MRILVTGATGFVGNQVINQLVNTEHKIITTSIESRQDIESKFKWLPQVEYISQNLDQDNSNYFEYFKKPDLLIHLSWANLPNYKELFHIEKNLITNYSFIKNMLEHGLKDLSCIGTCFEYGMQDGCLSEDIETKPSTVYGLAKDTLRRFIQELKKYYEFNFKWLRLFYPYGKGQSPKSLFSQLDKTITNKEKVFNMSGGEQLRDYLTVEKVAEYIMKCSIQNNEQGIINICSGVPISIRKFVENYIQEKNAKIELNLGYYPYCDYEPMAFWGNANKLKKIIGIKDESQD